MPRDVTVQRHKGHPCRWCRSSARGREGRRGGGREGGKEGGREGGGQLPPPWLAFRPAESRTTCSLSTCAAWDIDKYPQSYVRFHIEKLVFSRSDAGASAAVADSRVGRVGGVVQVRRGPTIGAGEEWLGRLGWGEHFR